MTVKNVRMHGAAPYSVAVIHGGPGAAGEMAPVARQLALSRGVLEPLQTMRTLSGQVDELRNVLEEHGEPPLTLIGFSWGAWLSVVCASTYPAVTRKLILVGSGPYEQKYAARILDTRLERLSPGERAEARSLIARLDRPGDASSATEAEDQALARLGALFSRADAYDPIALAADDEETVDCEAKTFRDVWREAAELRRSGKLLESCRWLGCPVTAIHGDHDPHPAEGVREPLSANVARFRFILLARCGHKPWIERQARAAFFRTLEREILRED